MWQIINRVVDIVLLVLSLSLLTLLWANTKEIQNTDIFVEKIVAFQEATKKMVESNTRYLEGRVNRVQEMGDSYQSNMSTRVYVLEQKIDKLEKENKASSRNININTNSAISN